MHTPSTPKLRPSRLSQAVSLALFSLMTGHAALAQEAPKDAGDKKEDGTIVVTVNATRASQQSSIDRKKNAATL